MLGDDFEKACQSRDDEINLKKRVLRIFGKMLEVIFAAILVIGTFFIMVNLISPYIIK